MTHGVGYETVQRYRMTLRENGFEPIDFHGRQMFWKELCPNGKHVVIETIGGATSAQIPDWKKKRALITMYSGPDLCGNQIHQETAYTIDDLLEFMKDLREGKVL